MQVRSIRTPLNCCNFFGVGLFFVQPRWLLPPGNAKCSSVALRCNRVDRPSYRPTSSDQSITLIWMIERYLKPAGFLLADLCFKGLFDWWETPGRPVTSFIQDCDVTFRKNVTFRRDVWGLWRRFRISRTVTYVTGNLWEPMSEWLKKRELESLPDWRWMNDDVTLFG